MHGTPRDWYLAGRSGQPVLHGANGPDLKSGLNTSSLRAVDPVLANVALKLYIIFKFCWNLIFLKMITAIIQFKSA
jgi:hypothetical protein